MDQNSENGADKRNWRERLGIGAADGQKAMPKAADGFKPAEAPVAAAAPRPAAPAPVRAAPMAPRPAPRPATPVAPRVAPVGADALANKLKTQRDAAEKLAVQRVQAAKQRAEASIAQATNAAGKPKFSFADEEAKLAVQQQPQSQPVAQVQRPIQTQPPRPAPAPQQPYAPPPNPYAGQVQPPRPQLGVNPGYVMPPAYPQGQPYQPMPPQQGYQPQYQQPPYQQPPAYRPIDPNTGYAPQPGYNPNMRPQYVPPAAPMTPGQMPQGQPQRLQAPMRAGSASAFAPNPRLTNPPQRMPQMPMAGDEGEDDVFEQPQARPTRRATAGEYQQAYRNEVAYEEEPQRSNGLWMILGLAVLGLLVAIGAVLAYSHYLKPQLSSSNGANVPVVAAPATPTKVVPDKSSAATDQPVKKMIYDRIEGDHEVLGGQVQSTEEPPAQPAGSGTNVAPPVDPNKAVAPADNTGTGTDGVPLPLPPPPGGGTGQQGSLAPSDKTDIANVTPAAEQSSAANLSQASTTTGQSQIATIATKTSDIAPPPVPGSQPTAKPAEVSAVKPEIVQPVAPKLQPSKLADAAPDGSEEIGADKPVVTKKLPVAAASKPMKSLGASPVVLVPPAKSAEPSAFAKPKVKSKTSVALAEPAAPADGNSIYGGGIDSTATASSAATNVNPPKKTRSIFDLFKASNSTADATAPAIAPVETVVAPVVPAKPATQVALAAPQVSTPAAGTGAYVIQLASFKSRAEATAEYQRLGAKHGAIITRYAPIIEAAQVAGSTRYRLNLGPMASTNVASSVCSSLFAAGERDCIVHRQ